MGAARTLEGPQPAWLRALGDALEALPIGVCVRAPDGRVLLRNRRASQSTIAGCHTVDLVGGAAFAERREALGRALLDLAQLLGVGALLVEPSLRVGARNDRAAAWLGEADGLRLEAGRLLADRCADARALRAALRCVLDGADAPVVVRVRRAASELPLVVIVAPPPIANEAGAKALVLVRNPHEPSTLDPALLQYLFELTPAEARIASRLAAGLRPREIADDQGLSVGTVRNQIKRVFAKTGTDRQAELVRVLLTATLDRAKRLAGGGR
jgi:DNA-binding CsgD family transcriptional regulator